MKGNARINTKFNSFMTEAVIIANGLRHERVNLYIKTTAT